MKDMLHAGTVTSVVAVIKLKKVHKTLGQFEVRWIHLICKLSTLQCWMAATKDATVPCLDGSSHLIVVSQTSCLSKYMKSASLDTKGYVESECHLAMLSIASLETPALVAQLPVRSLNVAAASISIASGADIAVVAMS